MAGSADKNKSTRAPRTKLPEGAFGDIAVEAATGGGARSVEVVVTFKANVSDDASVAQAVTKVAEAIRETASTLGMSAYVSRAVEKSGSKQTAAKRFKRPRGL